MARPVRRNIAHLTDAERTKYIEAVAKADKRFWSGGDVSYWDFQDLSHQTTHVHGGPKFLLWHRELCNRYERLLQEIDPDVALHYWDWTTDPRSSSNGSGGTTDLSVDTFMGTMNGNVAGKLAPLHNGGQFNGSREQTGLPKDPPQTILRNLPPGPPAGADTDSNIIHAGDAFPQAQQWHEFRRHLEQIHGGVHVAFGAGNIGDPSGHQAFQDPFVFLLHANVDRLYAMWQCQPGQEWRLNPALVYGADAATTGLDGLTGNTLAPWDGSSGVHPFTPAGGLILVKPYLDPSLVVPPCYDTLPTTVTKAAPAGTTPLRFLDVPTGKTTARALRVEVRGCASVTINGALTGDPAFTLHQASVQSPAPDDFTTTTVFLWVKYHAGAAGTTANGHLQATCPQTGTTIDVDIVADAIMNPNVAVSAVLDSSGSMSLPSGVPGLDRMAVLHQAAPTFIALLDDDDGVGVVRFDTDATPVSPVTRADSVGAGGGRDNATAAINAQATNPLGMTAIGDGIEAAHNQLTAALPGFAQQAILVFTDGEETESKYISDVVSLINERVYGVGLGTPDQLSPTGLDAITRGTHGYLALTGPLGPDGVMRLAKYFSQLLAGVTNVQIVTDPPGFVAPGTTERVPFTLTEADQRADVIVLTEAPFAIQLSLTAPDGTTVTAGPDATALDAPAMTCLRVPLPLASSPAAHGGPWVANLSVDPGAFRRYLQILERRRDVVGIQRAQGHGLAYTLTVHAVSDLEMTATASQTGHAPGSYATIRAVLTDSGIPLERQAFVTVDVTMPDGTAATMQLTEVEPGIHETVLPLPQAGLYDLLVRAVGQAFSGRAFSREEFRTVAVWTDPVRQPPTGGGGDHESWCKLLLCVLEDDRAGRALAERGVNVDGVRDCVKRFCERKG
jgi:Common central domain of tyrosinase/von Willebrand factor type A domain